MNKLLQSALRADEFICISTQRGSLYGKIIDVDLPWIEVRDCDDDEVSLISLDPAQILQITVGDNARARHAKQRQQAESHAAFASMMEHAVSGRKAS